VGFVRSLVAALAAGARVLLVHPRSPPAEVLGLARRARARATLGEDGGVVATPFAAGPSDGEPVAGAILPSSGTTGAPRLVLREAAALRADAINVARALAIGPGDRLLAVVPLGHSYGLDMTLAALWSGATLVPHAEFDAAAVAGSLEAGVSVYPAVPFMIEALARAGPGRRPAGLRLVFTAGAALPGAVRAAFEAAWHVPVGQLYGATELGSVTLSDPAEPGFIPASVGRPFPGVSIRITAPDDAGRSLPIGEEGHVAVSAPSMLSRYLGVETPLVDGHLLTGDLGRVDRDGRLFIAGRLKLLIDVGGLKVNPLEVEAALREHPAVGDCVVVPMPLSETVTKLRAVYTARRETRAGELRRFLRERLAPHKVPRVFEPIAALPRSPSGKVLRHPVAVP
jgi:acyl-CoA synthetase (AMP-forming)/AMP-acid ligase II